MAADNHCETWQQFYWRWAKTTFEHPWSITEKIGTVLALGLPLFAWLASKWHWLPVIPEPVLSPLMWQVPLGMLAILILIRIIPAPYWIYRERHSAAVESERELTQQLTARAEVNLKKEWKELAARFETLPNYIRADWQCNRKNNETIYENWNFAGGTNTQVETLCRYAGKLLMKSPHIRRQLSAQITEQSDPAWNWLFFLKERRNAFSQNGAYGQTEDGTIILMGTIYHIGVASQTACLDCVAAEL
jgi:hypothetical protein